MNQHVAVASGAASIRIRPIEPGDAGDLERFYAALSADSRRRRFLSGGAAVGRAAATFFCGTDHRHREGFIAVADGLDRPAIVGHLCLEPAGRREAELALVVADADQGHGIGRRLMADAAQWARHHGVDRLTATCAADNAGIIRLFRALAWPLAFAAPAAGTVVVSIDVATGATDPLSSLRARHGAARSVLDRRDHRRVTRQPRRCRAGHGARGAPRAAVPG